MFTLILVSFLAGVLTVLAPCVLPLLPVILGGGLASTDKKRPYIIIASLMVSLMLFTILLKASTLLIYIDPKTWDYLSGGILILFGLTLIFPKVWSWFVVKTGIESWSQNSLQNASQKNGIWGPIGIGAALGPVFSSCNPTYSLLLATVLPLDIVSGLIGLVAYFIGLGLILLLVTLFGRSILGKFRFFANPNGVFRKILGILILVVGVLITFGTIKQLQTWVVENGNFSFFGKLEERLNDSIDTKIFKDKDQMMCTGTNCAPKNPTDSGATMDRGNAPELTGIKGWINSEPLTLETLRGKVVLIDFWTYSCINCIRTQPYLNAWYDKYEKGGLVIIGVHAPEFAFEKLEKNVREAVEKAGIKYPVALDNDFKTWNAYDNRYWPAKYLIDQNGKIVYKHFGEGKYEETEKEIQDLLALPPGQRRCPKGAEDCENSIHPTPFDGAHGRSPLSQGGITQQKTPETYLGSARGKLIQPDTYVIQLDDWQAFGNWKQEPEYIESTEDGQLLRLNFRAKDVYLVVSGTGNLEASTSPFFEDGRMVKLAPLQTKIIEVKNDDIYHVFDGEEYGKYTLQISATPGLRLHAFTFGD